MTLNEKDITNLVALMDIAVRAEGLQIAPVAIVLQNKLETMRSIVQDNPQ